MKVKVKRIEFDNVNLDTEAMITVTDEVIRTVYNLPKILKLNKDGYLIEVFYNWYDIADTRIIRKATEEDTFILNVLEKIKKYKDN